ncbi:MAG: hypothetical protein ACWA5L_07115 [bacterium]
MYILRFLLSLLAVAIIVIGTLLMISPLPLGVFLIIFGFLMLVVVNPAARPVLKWFRQTLPWIDRQLDRVEDHSPDIIAEPLRESDPQ